MVNLIAEMQVLYMVITMEIAYQAHGPEKVLQIALMEVMNLMIRALQACSVTRMHLSIKDTIQAMRI